MGVLKIILLLLLVTTLQAKDTKWHKLKKLEHSQFKDFNLKERIVALEFRNYTKYGDSKKYSSVSTGFGIFATPLHLLDKKLRQRFQRATPVTSTKGDIRHRPEYPKHGVNAFTIDRDGNILRMNEISDVISFLGKIDTPAEAQLILWMHYKHNAVKYRKVSKGYEMIIKYETIYDSPRGDFCTDGVSTTDKAMVNSKGKITYYKQVSKSKPKEYPCLHPSPPMPEER